MLEIFAANDLTTRIERSSHDQRIIKSQFSVTSQCDGPSVNRRR